MTPTNRQDFVTIALGVLGVVGGLFAAFYYLARTLDPAALAITLVLIVMFGLLIGAPFLWLIARLTRDRRAEIAPPKPPEIIDYNPAPSWARARPRVVDVMRYEEMGIPKPLGLPPRPPAALPPRQPDALRTTTKAGEPVTVPIHLAVRFAECPTPARAEWTGKRESYTNAGAFFQAHGMTDRDNRGGWKWKPEYSDPADRVAFVRQFANATTLVDADEQE